MWTHEQDFNLHGEEQVRAELQSGQHIDKCLNILQMAGLGSKIGEISHTFNNILGGILGYAQLLKLELPADDQARRKAEVIEQAAKRASRLISQLQLFSQRKTYQESVLKMRHVVDELVEIMESLGKRNVEIIYKNSADDVTVVADRAALSRAILNILLNGMEAMPDGGVLEIDCKCVQERDGDYVVVSVRDNGCGIDVSDRSRIFEPFFSRQNHISHVGMGLTTTQRQIDRIGGFIRVTSEVDEGSTFEVFIPIASRARPEVRTVVQQPQRQNDNPKEYTILVVEDEKELRNLATRLLTTQGFRVVSAADGQSATDLFSENSEKIDLVILDLVIPHVSGKRVFELIKDIAPECPVMLTSGFVNDFELTRQMLREHDKFLPKPWDLPELLHSVTTMLTASKEPATEK